MRVLMSCPSCKSQVCLWERPLTTLPVSDLIALHGSIPWMHVMVDSSRVDLSIGFARLFLAKKFLRNRALLDGPGTEAQLRSRGQLL